MGRLSYKRKRTMAQHSNRMAPKSGPAKETYNAKMTGSGRRHNLD